MHLNLLDGTTLLYCTCLYFTSTYLLVAFTALFLLDPALVLSRLPSKGVAAFLGSAAAATSAEAD